MGDEVNFVDDMITADGARELAQTAIQSDLYRFCVACNTQIAAAAREHASSIKVELEPGRTVKGAFFIRAGDDFTRAVKKHFESRGFKVNFSYGRGDEGCIAYVHLSW